jgi:hypothetical protein
MICVEQFVNSSCLLWMQCNGCVAFHVDDADTPICCTIQANGFLEGVFNLAPISSFFLSMCLLMFSYCLQCSLLHENFSCNCKQLSQQELHHQKFLSEFMMTLLLYVHDLLQILLSFWHTSGPMECVCVCVCVWIHGIHTHTHNDGYVCVCDKNHVMLQWNQQWLQAACRNLISAISSVGMSQWEDLVYNIIDPIRSDY